MLEDQQYHYSLLMSLTQDKEALLLIGAGTLRTQWNKLPLWENFGATAESKSLNCIPCICVKHSVTDTCNLQRQGVDEEF